MEVERYRDIARVAQQEDRFLCTDRSRHFCGQRERCADEYPWRPRHDLFEFRRADDLRGRDLRSLPVYVRDHDPEPGNTAFREPENYGVGLLELEVLFLMARPQPGRHEEMLQNLIKHITMRRQQTPQMRSPRCFTETICYSSFSITIVTVFLSA